MFFFSFYIRWLLNSVAYLHADFLDAWLWFWLVYNESSNSYFNWNWYDITYFKDMSCRIEWKWDKWNEWNFSCLFDLKMYFISFLFFPLTPTKHALSSMNLKKKKSRLQKTVILVWWNYRRNSYNFELRLAFWTYQCEITKMIIFTIYSRKN